MSALMEQLRQELNAARKAQAKARTLLLGTILSDVKNRQIELRRPVTDDDVLEVMRRGIKRRRESIEMYTTAGRGELAAREQAEVDELEHFLPAQVGEDELRAAVLAAIDGGATTLGAVMGQVLPRFKGRAEGGTVSALARAELARRA
ncbi:MAG: GatB/YqeY domain-containing protein [Gemmatimonadaceae bacterium]